MSSQKHKTKDGNVMSFIIQRLEAIGELSTKLRMRVKIWLKYVKTVILRRTTSSHATPHCVRLCNLVLIKKQPLLSKYLIQLPTFALLLSNRYDINGSQILIECLHVDRDVWTAVEGVKQPWTWFPKRICEVTQKSEIIVTLGFRLSWQCHDIGVLKS